MNGQRIALRQRRDLSEIIQAAFNLYQQNFAPLFLIAAAVIPLGVASAALQGAVEDSAGAAIAVAGIAILQVGVNLLAGAAIITGLLTIDRSQEPTFSTAYDVAFERFWTLLGGVLRAGIIVVLLLITIIGIPWAIQRAVRWLFVEQAIIIDGTTAGESLSRSAAAVEGRWWRTLGVGLVIAIIVTVPASIIAGAFSLAPVFVAGTVNSIVNALVLPFAITCMTLLYMDLQVRKESDERTASDAPA